MTKGISAKEPDPEIVYADIFHHPRHVSDRHPPMSLQDRAAQFSAYKALSGYEDMVGEEARLVGRRIELSEEERDVLNEQLSRISDLIADGIHPELTVTYFIPDPRKAGGRYETVRETVRRIDPVSRKLILERKAGLSRSNAEISIPDILEIHGFGDDEL